MDRALTALRVAAMGTGRSRGHLRRLQSWKNRTEVRFDSTSRGRRLLTRERSLTAFQTFGGQIEELVDFMRFQFDLWEDALLFNLRKDTGEVRDHFKDARSLR